MTLLPLGRRWQPRFTLRTLLLFVLLVGSSATLWWNWHTGPCSIAWSLAEPAGITHVWYSDDDNYLFIHYVDFARQPALSCVDIRQARSGRRHALLTNSRGSRLNRTKPSDYGAYSCGHYLLIENTESHATTHATLFDWHDKLELPLQEKLGEFSESGYFFHLTTRSLQLYGGDRHVVWSLPNLDNRRIFPGCREACLSDEWFAEQTDTALKIHDYKSGSTREVPLTGTDWRLSDRISKNARHPLILSSHDDTRKDFRQLVVDPLSARTHVLLDTEYVSLSRDGELAAILPVGLNTMRLVKTWSGEVIREFPGYHGNFMASGNLLIYANPQGVNAGNCQLLDPRDLRVLWSTNRSISYLQNESLLLCGNHFHTNNSYDTDWNLHVQRSAFDGITINAELCDARTGTLLLDFTSPAVRKTMTKDAQIVFAANDALFAVWPGIPYEQQDPATPDQKRVTVWHQHRPWQWYGIVWLREFWLTLVFGVGFLWSVWRDRLLGKRA